MRLFALLFILFAATSAYAAYSNDSSSVDINYGGSAEDQLLPPPSSGGNQSGGNTGSNGQSGNGNTDEDSLEDSDEVTIPVVIVVTPPANGTSGSGSNDGENGGETVVTTLTVADIIATLKGNQAFTIEKDPGGGWWILRISGEKARAALKARGVTKITLLSSFRNKFLSRGDLTIAAASSLLDNENLEEIIISLDTLSFSYKARGRLLGVFPWEYPIAITIDPYGTSIAERVAVKFPWYRFFLQTYVSGAVLQEGIDRVMSTVLAEETEEMDMRTRLYLAVTESIKSRFDTVEGSL